MHDMLCLSWGIKILLANININQQRIRLYLLSAAVWLILSRKIKYLLSSRSWRTLRSYSNCIYKLCIFLYCSLLLSRYVGVLNIISAWHPSFFSLTFQGQEIQCWSVRHAVTPPLQITIKWKVKHLSKKKSPWLHQNYFSPPRFTMEKPHKTGPHQYGGKNH